MDSEIFTSVFTGMRQRLLSLAGRMLGNEDDAADAVQDAFCKLWQRRKSMSTISEVEGVSVVTVRNLCVDNLRQGARMNMVSIDDNQDVERVEDNGNEAEEREFAFKELDTLMQKHLNEVQRKIVIMREYENRSFSEIANILGMQEPNVRVSLSRTRKLIREIYRNNI